MFLTIKCLFFLTTFFYVSSRYITEYNTNHGVEEIQHAICKIATEDIQASANATITRQLKGVCTSKEIDYRLTELEKRILNEINIIKHALHVDNVILEPSTKVQTKTLELTAHNHYKSNDYDYLNTIESVKTEKVFNPQTVTYQTAQTTEIINTTSINQTDENTTSAEYPTISSTTISNIHKNLEIAYKRDIEAAKNNITIQNTELGRSFLYFWKIYDIDEILTYSETNIDSPIFYLLGHPLQIKFYPRHLGTHYVAFELASMDKFNGKHKFTVLNQNNEKGDLTSQVLGMNAAIFRISNQKLSNVDFTADGSLMIKVVVALRS